MLEKVSGTIERFKLIEKGDKVLVAVSGGIDSVTLLHILQELRYPLGISLAVAHLDHQLRGAESAKDARFVEELARSLGLPIISKSMDVRSYINESGLSEEQSARQVRYSFLESVSKKLCADKIALGHNLNDQVETFLMRLIRGTGLKGLRGMLPKRDIYIRPLIECKRQEIQEYARKKSLEFREDRTNVSVKYLRNKIRWELLPMLESEYNPKIVDAVFRTENVVREITAYLDKQAEKILNQAITKEEPEVIILDREMLLSQEVALRRTVIRKAIWRVKGSLKDIEFIHIQDILTEITNQKPRSEIHLPGKLKFEKNRGQIKLTVKKPAPSQPKPYRFELTPGEKKPFPKIGWEFATEKIAIAELKNMEEIYLKPLQVIVDLDKIREPLIVRNRREGDKFRPLGMNGSKKIKDLLIDQKVDYTERDSIPLICDQKGIIWVVGIRLSEDYKITSRTRFGLKITASQTIRGSS